MGGGDNFCCRGTISASGLRPWGTISASRLCPGGQNLRGDRICSDTGTIFITDLTVTMCTYMVVILYSYATTVNILFKTF